MSFALDYRKKMQAREQVRVAEIKADEGFVSSPVEAASDTGRQRRGVFLALLIAGAVLGVFNSGGLVQYSYDLADRPMGPKLIELSERWHELMSRRNAHVVVDRIRDTVTMARQSSWQDLAFGFGQRQETEQPGTNEANPVMPASAEPPVKKEKSEREEVVRPKGPVMRASVDVIE